MAFDPKKYLNGDIRQLAEDLLNNFSDGSLVLGPGENHIGQIGGSTVKLLHEFTRPANTTPYAVNDVVSSNATNIGGYSLGDNVARVQGGNGYFTGFRLVTDNSSTLGVNFRVHFGTYGGAFNETTDNSPLGLVYNNSKAAAYLGFVDLPATTIQGGSGIAYTQDNTQRFPFEADKTASKIYYLIETLNAFTPASGQKFSLHVFAEQN